MQQFAIASRLRHCAGSRVAASIFRERTGKVSRRTLDSKEFPHKSAKKPPAPSTIETNKIPREQILPREQTSERTGAEKTVTSWKAGSARKRRS